MLSGHSQVRGYPTLKLIRKGQLTNYEGEALLF